MRPTVPAGHRFGDTAASYSKTNRAKANKLTVSSVGTGVRARFAPVRPPGSMQAEFRAPRRRLRVTEELEAPLPLSPRGSSHFRAELLNQHVLVVDSDQSQKIHNQGYFGKGVLSRARPEHSISDQWEREYEELLTWARLALSAQGWDAEAVNQTLLMLSQPIKMEDVKKEMGGGREAEENGESGEPEGGVSPNRKRPRLGSGVEQEVKRNFQMFLCLCHLQAFFLVYGLGCLSVYLQQEPLTVMQLWRKFRSLRPDFISSYAAYHHFRSKGWVPKGGGGAKYGVNIMLYRKGPPFYHASYSVVIERADDAFGGSALRPFSWRSLAALSRITANVSKELMLCYIIYPADLSEHELDSPACLSRLKIQEVIVSRWVSSRERTEQDDI
uniref:tRNA-splicing endonuclease subunit Sen2 n=1 Tax=Amphilophus citrinellus TaxID=61819 RepID=A0A3Q0T422_AMPCI